MAVRLDANKMTTYSTDHDTEDLDDTLPIELLDCVETTTNEDWLTRDIPFRDKGKCAEPAHWASNDVQSGSLMFNPPLCSTRLKPDGSSDELMSGSSSLMAHHGSSEQLVRSSPRTNEGGPCVPPLMPAASMEFQPLRCSTAVTANDVRSVPSVDFFEVRCDTTELDSLRYSTDVGSGTEKRNGAVRQNGINPTQCSTKIVQDILRNAPYTNIVRSPDKVSRPSSPEEFLSARGSSDDNIPSYGNETQFVTAFSNIVLTNSCARNEQNMPDGVESLEKCETSPCTETDLDVDSGLSIMMQCHLKIRKSGKVISNIQANPQIEFSLFKDSPSAVDLVISTEKALPTKTSPLTTENKVQNKPKDDVVVERQAELESRLTSENGIHSKATKKENRDCVKQDRAGFQSPMPTMSSVRRIPIGNQIPIKLRHGAQCPEKASAPPRERVFAGTGTCIGDRHMTKVDNRFRGALENLASSNMQKVVGAFATLDAARTDLLCETIVELDLVDRIYDFFSKMNRSVAHQVACVHATSLLLDLAKYSFSTESAWQNGNKVALLFNLMTIWVTKDNAIFMNSAAILWVFSRDVTRAAILRRSASSQNKLLEKIALKLNTRISKFTNNVKAPALKPSWSNAGVRRTFENPIAAFSGLCNVLQNTLRAK